MDLNKILSEYDTLFGEKTTAEITAFLEEHVSAALYEKDYETALSLMTELVGYCRDTSQRELGLKTADQVLSLCLDLGITEGPSYGTILLNIANAYRAFGLYNESETGYRKTEGIFRDCLEYDDYLFASLYNNWGLLKEELSDFPGAEKLFSESLPIIRKYPDKQFNLATTLTNLAMAEMHQNPPKMNSAFEHLSEAEAIHQTVQGTEFHYSATLSAFGDYEYLQGNYETAAGYYYRSLNHLKNNVGDTDAVRRIYENYMHSCQKAGIVPVPESEIKSASDKITDDDMKNQTGSNRLQIDTDSNSNVESNPHTKLETKARDFYANHVRPMLEQSFSDYLPFIAAGFAGEGSEHFGFDDEISTDHDYEPGICLWISENSPAAEIRNELETAYDKLYQATFGKEPDPLARHGVRMIDEYFAELTGIGNISQKIERLINASPINTKSNDAQNPSQNHSDFSIHKNPETITYTPDWFHPTEQEISGIAASVNGVIYDDPEGTLTKIRTFFRENMPEDWRRKMLATLFHEYCQYAQCNYSRMMKRKDYVTAGICKAMAADSAAKIVYYLNRTYPPYYKWRMRGVKELKELPEIADLCRAVFDFGDGREEFEQTGTDKTAMTFDIISAYLLHKAAEQGLIAVFDQNRVFADDYITEIAGLTGNNQQSHDQKTDKEFSDIQSDNNEDTAMNNESNTQNSENSGNIPREQLIKDIVKTEWDMFDKVINEGGRADCQNNWGTFSVMRESQYRTWPDELLSSYLGDLLEGIKTGHNLITEKYGRMMESTAPERFAEIKDQLPVLDEKRIAISEEIIRIQVGWMEDFAAKYPLMAGNARTIHTADDTPFDTSYETYLRGELSTYSKETLALYGRFIVSLVQEGRNLAYEIMTQTALLYGYQSVEDAEEQMKKTNW